MPTGLAWPPPVGFLRRVVIVADAEDNMLELVNLRDSHPGGEQEGFEGCLVPGRWVRGQAPLQGTGCAPRPQRQFL